MNLLKSIQKNSIGIVFALAILLRILLLNFNAAEWGDSYRILRAAEISRFNSYPIDEKRPPLFSYILSLRPEQNDPILFGRIVMFFITILVLLVFYEFIKKHIKDSKLQALALVMLLLNPVYLYWSLRIYADVPFSLYVLTIAVLFQKWESEKSLFKNFVLGFLAALSVTLRFEGYLLMGSLLLATYLKGFSKKEVFSNIKAPIVAFVGALTVLIPFLLYRNPLNSSYFNEPSGRSYDLVMILIFLVSLLFVFGSLVVPSFLILKSKNVIKFFWNNKFVLVFTVTSLILILLWPAAIPRLFVSIIPFLITAVVISFKDLSNTKHIAFLSLGIIGFYVITQFFLKLQFLVVLKPIFILIILINLVSAIFLYLNKLKFFYASILLSMLVWTGATLYIHKNIYRSLSEASQYASQNLSGLVLHNDINSVADWYLNYSPKTDMSIKGEQINIKSIKELKPEVFRQKNAQYVIITNEHDASWQPDPTSLPYLSEIKVFRYNVNSGNFFTGVYKFDDRKQ